MNKAPRSFAFALITAVLASFQTQAGTVSIPRVNVGVSLGAAAAVPLFNAGSLTGSASLAPSSILPLMPMLSALPAPIALTPVPSLAAARQTARATSPSPTRAATPAERVAPALAAFEPSVLSDGAPFDGTGKHKAVQVAAHILDRMAAAGFIKNVDGVWVSGRSAEMSHWINSLFAELSAKKVPLKEVMDVMDDAYREGVSKLRSVELAASEHKIVDSSVHLEGTRNWVDAILTDADGRDIAVHTHSAYFHPGHGNADSEISEAIGREDKYLEKAIPDFAAGGLAEQTIGRQFALVQLNFNTAGYKEIEDHLRSKEKEINAKYPGRFAFRYITEPRVASAELRAQYNRLMEKYSDQPEGIRAISDGVTYSRQVGLAHELNSHKTRIKMGLKITQAGRDFFVPKVLPDGRVVMVYSTEFDAKSEPDEDADPPAPEEYAGVTHWEDKSARVWMPLDKVMEETFLYKLRKYRADRKYIEESSGGAPLKVAFSVDVGGLNRKAAKQGILVWQDPRQQELMEYLLASAPALSEEYGFPVSFIFVNSHPGEDADLFNKEPMKAADWVASQQGGHKQSPRKHGRGSRR